MHIGLRIVRFFRNLFADTPVEKWKITGLILRLIYTYSLKEFTDKEGNIRTKYKGIELSLPPTDRAIVPSIINGYFESFVLDTLAKLAKESSLFFDVGANVGLFSLIAAKSNPKMAIICFEPINSNIDYIRLNKTANRSKNIKIVPSAVGDKDGEVDIYLSSSSSTHSVSKKHSRSVVFQKAKLTSLNTYIKSHTQLPDLMKIDVEGYEVFVLQGASRVLKAAPTLFIEFDHEALDNCGTSAEKFVDIIFMSYKSVYIFDDKRERLHKVDKQDLLKKKVYSNLNLLAINNKKHKKAIADII